MRSVHDEIRELELRLLEPSVRGSAEEVGALLSDDFVEFGSSGRSYDKAQIIAALLADPGGPPHVADFRTTPVAEGVVLATYRAGGSLRSSLWKREGKHWRMLFHQGTRSDAARSLVEPPSAAQTGAPLTATRVLSLTDLEPLVGLYLRAFNAPPWNDGWTLEAARERLERLLLRPHSLGVAAEVEGHVVSFALGHFERWQSSEHFHLIEMCTAPERQRQGVGTVVLDALLRELQGRGAKATFLQTLPDSPASRFYRNHGFTPLKLESLRRRL